MSSGDYLTQKQKDLEFLKEMWCLTQSLKIKPDITRLEKLDKMIADWIDELEQS